MAAAAFIWTSANFETALIAKLATPGATSIYVAGATGFRKGQSITIGSSTNAEAALHPGRQI